MVPPSSERSYRARCRWTLIFGLIVSLPLASLRAAPERQDNCGPFALYSACGRLGVETSLDTLRAELLSQDQGTSLLQLSQAAQWRGLTTRAAKLTADELLGLSSPAIVFVGGNHFVLVAAVDARAREVFVIDEAGPPRWTAVRDFASAWQGEALILNTPRRPAGPKLWLPSTKAEMPALTGGRGETRTVTLFNIGDQPLELRSIKFSCPCAEGVFEPATVPPGGHSKLNLVIDSSDKKTTLSVNALILTNETNRGKSIELTAPIKKTVEFLPSFIALGDFAPDAAPMEFSARLRAPGPPLDPTPAFLAEGFTFLGVKRVERDDLEIRIRVDPAKLETDPDGRFRTVVGLKIKHPQYEYASLAVAGRRLPPFELMPAATFSAGVRPGQALRYTFAIKRHARRDGEVQITAAEAVHWKLAEDQLLIETTAPNKPGLFRRTVRVEASGASRELSIVGVVAAGAAPEASRLESKPAGKIGS
jgi:hypothetical protein